MTRIILKLNPTSLKPAANTTLKQAKATVGAAANLDTVSASGQTTVLVVVAESVFDPKY